MTTMLIVGLLAPMFVFVALVLIPTCTSCKPITFNYYAAFKMILLMIMFAGAALILSLFQAREYYYDNFEEYRCKPWFMPIVSLVRGDISTLENYNICTRKSSLMALGSLSKPLMGITSGMSTGLNYANKHVDTTSEAALQLGKDATYKIETSQLEMSQMATVIRYIFIKIQAIFDKIIAIIFNIYLALVTLVDFLQLIFLLPKLFMLILFIGLLGSIGAGIGSIAFGTGLLYLPFGIGIVPAICCFFGGAVAAVIAGIVGMLRAQLKVLQKEADGLSYCCFHHATPIVLEGGRLCAASEVRPGMQLLGGGVVRGVLKVRSDVHDWHRVGTQTVVAAGHQMWCHERSRWMTVGALGASRAPPERTHHPMRYSFVVSDHRVPTLDGWFLDAQETSDAKRLAREAHAVLYRLNGGAYRGDDASQPVVDPRLERGEDGSGFPEEDTHVAMADGSVRRLANVAIGDRLASVSRPTRDQFCVDDPTNTNHVLGVCTIVGRQSERSIPLDQIVLDPKAQGRRCGGRDSGRRRLWRKMYDSKMHDCAQHHTAASAGSATNTTNRPTTPHIRRHLITSHGAYTIRSDADASSSPTTVRDFNELASRV